MEKSEDFQKVVADIKQLEDHLLSLGEDAEKITKYGEEMEREVEKHFMSCINALAARQESLLRELGEKINIQKLRAAHTHKEVSNGIETRRMILKTGSFVYTTDTKAAEYIWKGVTNLPSLKTSTTNIRLDLPPSLLQAIRAHGEVVVLENKEKLSTSTNSETVTLDDTTTVTTTALITLAPSTNVNTSTDPANTTTTAASTPIAPTMTTETAATTTLVPSAAVPVPATTAVEPTPSNNIAPTPTTGQTTSTLPSAFASAVATSVAAIIAHAKTITVAPTTPTAATESVAPACLYSTVEKATTFAGSYQTLVDGRGPLARFTQPQGICWNPHDDCLYVCDTANNAIRKINMQGQVRTIVLGGNMNAPSAIVMNHKTNEFFILSQSVVLKLAASGLISTFAGGNGFGSRDGVGRQASFYIPQDIAIDQQTGTLFVTECMPNSIRKISPQGEVTTLKANYSRADGESDGRLSRIWFDGVDRSLLLTDYFNGKLTRVALNGDVSTVCSVPSPISVTTTKEFILVLSSYDDVYRVTRQGVVHKLTKPDVTDIRTCLRISNRVALHEPSQSLFFTESNNTISRMKIN